MTARPTPLFVPTLALALALALALSLGAPDPGHGQGAPGGEFAAAEAQAMELLRAGRLAEAEPIVQALVRTEPDVARHRYLLGFCLLGQHRAGPAEEQLRRAVAAEPTRHEWLHALAKALLEQGRSVAASSVLDRAIALDPRPEYRFAKASCAINLGRSLVARRELEQGLASRPTDEGALLQLGRVLADQGADAEALAVLRRALAANPANVEARFRKGLAERKAGTTAEAMRDFEAVVSAVPLHAGALYNLGQLLVLSGRAPEGRARLAQMARASELEDRIQFVAEFVTIDPRNLEKRLELARLQLEAGQTNEALVTLQAAAVLGPPVSATYRLFAQALGRLGRSEDAARAAEFAASLEAGNPAGGNR